MLTPKLRYMFSDSPDAILIKVYESAPSVITDVIGDDEGHNEASHFHLENKRQTQIMTQLHGKCVPKKLRQRIAGMHSVLSMQVAKAVATDQDITNKDL